MVDRETLERRLNALGRYLADLARYRDVSPEEFVAERSVHDLAERYVHLAVEAAIDIGNHIIADEGLETPDSYRAVFGTLAKADVLPASLAQRLAGWAGLRNVLVHDYLDIDHGIVHRAISEELDDLKEFARVVAERFL